MIITLEGTMRFQVIPDGIEGTGSIYYATGNPPERVARVYADMKIAKLLAAAPEMRDVLRDLLGAMETPRTRKAGDAWVAAHALLRTLD